MADSSVGTHYRIPEGIANAVRKGAALLDENAPGWRDRIVLPELQMSECWTCVVGQALEMKDRYGRAYVRYYKILAGWFGRSLDVHNSHDEAWDPVHAEERAHGFNADDYDLLRDAWIGYIKGEWS